VNNRVDRAIGEVMEVVDRVMGRSTPMPWPTAREAYLQRSTQAMVDSDLASDGATSD
jgi:hypothetical protein